MKKLIICFFSLLSFGFAQVSITYDNGVKESMSAHFAYKSEEKEKGFRVQICSESGNEAKDLANGAKARFYQLYDGYKAYMVWEQPNFKIRVGDFKSRLEANLFWQKIVTDFPTAYVVMCEIEKYKND